MQTTVVDMGPESTVFRICAFATEVALGWIAQGGALTPLSTFVPGGIVVMRLLDRS